MVCSRPFTTRLMIAVREARSVWPPAAMIARSSVGVCELLNSSLPGFITSPAM
jgi:hypothetical protein